MGRARWARVAALFGLAAACGGQAFSAGDGGDEGSAGSSSGASSGTSSSGGASGGGGGSSASGSSSGAGSSASSSGSTSSGSSSSGGSASGGSSSGSSSGGGSSASGSSNGGGSCDATCGVGRACCANGCVNLQNDPENCGVCGIKCAPGTYCNGSCKPIPCAKEGGSCSSGTICCGTACCSAGQLCCEEEGPVGSLYPVCFTPTASQPTCAPGCAPLCQSDRNLKRDIEPVDEQAVLERVAEMPVSTWSYKSDDPTVRHLGPMAQDFRAAFGLGDTDRAYNSIDAHGVAMAAIKALYERSREQDARIDRLEQENAELRKAASCKP
ncbi:MAG: tail fiber domain-containing protein [Polyangiaceae bacterium]